jgi:hypothetical protein
MPADGLTKSLPKQKHALWSESIGLQDLTDRLTDIVET